MIIGATLLTASTASAASPSNTLWVNQADPRCPYVGDGSQGAPFCTIGAAAAVASPGITVEVESGTYSEQVKPAQSGTSGSPITYTAAPGAAVTVTGAQYGFVVSSKSWIVISGFNVTSTASYGIYVQNSSNITISNNQVSYAGLPVSGSTHAGIYLTATTNSLIAGNTAFKNTDAGIYLQSGTTGVEIRGNTTYANARQYTRAAPGIDVNASPGNIVDRNISYSNEDSGIQVYNGSNNTVVYDNLSYNNGDHGIDTLNSPNPAYISNTVYNNHTAGINVEGYAGTTASSGATIRNNISVDNGLTSTTTKGDIRVDASSVVGSTIDSDLLWLDSPGTLVTWGSTLYSSLSALNAATGQETRGIQGSPSFVNPSTADFRLTEGSPAIDSADSSAPDQPTTDLVGNSRIDDPATPNTGIGPRAFDDRGALEYQPPSGPAAALTVSPPVALPPATVIADSSASTDAYAQISSFIFNFGDGTVVGPLPGPTATHTYTTPGVYRVTVTVTDTAGLTAQASSQFVVASPNAGPAAALAVSPSSGPGPLLVTADASASASSDGTPITSYTFNFGDGATVGPQSGPTATHTYPATGNYTVMTTVTDALGRTATATQAVTVLAPDSPPVPALTISPSSGAAPLPVLADASGSTDHDPWPITSYAFNFGDGTSTGSQSAATASHTYTNAGTYTVTVTVTDTAGLSAQAKATVAVKPSPTLNFVGNPGFETGTSGWNGGGYSGITVTQTLGGHSGSYAAVIANAGTASAPTCLLNDSPNWVATTYSGNYLASLWVRADTPGAKLTLRIREYSGSTFLGQQLASVALGTSWQQISLTYVPISPGTSTLDFNAYITNAPTGNCFWADDASLTVS